MSLKDIDVFLNHKATGKKTIKLINKRKCATKVGGKSVNSPLMMPKENAQSSETNSKANKIHPIKSFI